MKLPAVDLPTKSDKERKEYTFRHISYCSLFWLFIFGSIIGFILEGLWCALRKGSWESHSSTIWGPFCIIYGVGAVSVYIASSILKNKNILLQFILFSVVGSLVEYFGSLLQEIVFGSKSWDYSCHFMNIGGRVSLKMALIWGVLGITFTRFVFPILATYLEKIDGKFWKIGCIVLSIFMAVNFFFSSAAVMRWKERLTGYTPPANALEQFLDKTYGDNEMQKNYPNMKFST